MCDSGKISQQLGEHLLNTDKEKLIKKYALKYRNQDSE